jgi:hypothetical protein
LHYSFHGLLRSSAGSSLLIGLIAGWCRYAAPDLEDSFWKELVRLPMNFLSTWTTGYMAYDDHQWALLPLLLSSMLVYTVLSATMFVKFRFRVAIYIGMLLYFHQDAAKDTGKLSLSGGQTNAWSLMLAVRMNVG